MKYVIEMESKNGDIVYIANDLRTVTSNIETAYKFDTIEEAKTSKKWEVFNLIEYQIKEYNPFTSSDKVKIIGSLLIAMNKNDKLKASEMLKELTSFVKEDGSGFSGISSLKDFESDKQISTVYGKVKKMFLNGVWDNTKNDILSRS